MQAKISFSNFQIGTFSNYLKVSDIESSSQFSAPLRFFAALLRKVEQSTKVVQSSENLTKCKQKSHFQIFKLVHFQITSRFLILNPSSRFSAPLRFFAALLRKVAQSTKVAQSSENLTKCKQKSHFQIFKLVHFQITSRFLVIESSSQFSAPLRFFAALLRKVAQSTKVAQSSENLTKCKQKSH